MVNYSVNGGGSGSGDGGSSKDDGNRNQQLLPKSQQRQRQRQQQQQNHRIHRLQQRLLLLFVFGLIAISPLWLMIDQPTPSSLLSSPPISISSSVSNIVGHGTDDHDDNEDDDNDDNNDDDTVETLERLEKLKHRTRDSSATTPIRSSERQEEEEEEATIDPGERQQPPNNANNNYNQRQHLSVLEDFRIQNVENSPLLEYMTRNIIGGVDGGGRQDDREIIQEQKASSESKLLGDPMDFQQQHCNLQGQPWCPSVSSSPSEPPGKKKNGRLQKHFDDDRSWMIGAPYALIMGVKKSGTTSLFRFLSQHVDIIPGIKKELLFFTRKRFDMTKYLEYNNDEDDNDDDTKNDNGPSKGIGGGGHRNDTRTNKILVQTMRNDLTQRNFPTVKEAVMGQRKRTNVIRSIDGTPQSLFDWPTMIHPILCGMPWIRLIVITRDPVERIWSHYNFIAGYIQKTNAQRMGTSKPKLKPLPSFEEWIAADMNLLAQLGLVRNNNNNDDGNDDESRPFVPLTDDELIHRWDRYTVESKEGPVGRGFYGSQLFQWFKAIRHFGRDPKEAFRILRLEDMKGDGGNGNDVAKQMFSELTEWLGLDPERHNRVLGVQFAQKMKTVYRVSSSMEKPTLSDETRQLLEDFYRPYNQLLGTLLSDSRWDYSRQTNTADNHDEKDVVVVWPRNTTSTSQVRGMVASTQLFEKPSEESLARVPCTGWLVDNEHKGAPVWNNKREQNFTATTKNGRKRKFNDDELFEQLDSYRSQSAQSPILEYMQRQLNVDPMDGTLGDSTTYQQQYCSLEGGEWCPSGSDAWQQSAPAFFVLGVKKSGTTALFSFLMQHPQVIKGTRKELYFFNQRKFPYEKYIEDGNKDGNVTEREPGGKVKVQTVRKDLLELFPSEKLRQPEGSNDLRHISFDATPQYLYNWVSTSREILCTCPWAKFIVIVRNPTDRLWSHYNYILSVHKNQGKPVLNLSFEEFLLRDLHSMHKNGLIERKGHRMERFDTEDDIASAWSVHTRDTGEGTIGRNFYAFSLFGWFEELRRMGRDPKDSLKIVRLEDLSNTANDPNIPTKIFNEIMEWLGVKKLQRDTPTTFDQRMKTDYANLGQSETMSERTRKLLDDFHAPYNEMLAKLLDDPRWNYERRNATITKTNDTFDSVLVWPPNPDRNGEHSDGTAFFYSSPSKAGVCGG